MTRLEREDYSAASVERREAKLKEREAAWQEMYNLHVADVEIHIGMSKLGRFYPICLTCEYLNCGWEVINGERRLIAMMREMLSVRGKLP